jgi:hypothetical protein
MSTPLKAYTDSLAKLRDAETRVESIVTLIATSSNSLTHWKYTAVVGTGLEDFPMAGRKIRTLDAASWPTGADIHAAICDWHAAFLAMKQAWDAIPADEQAGAKTPPALPN